MKCWLRIALTLSVLIFGATHVSASPPRLLSATFSGGCQAFTIVVSGDGLTQHSAIVSYNITLKPKSGEPLVITDSFEVAPDKYGTFHKSFDATWKKFEFTLTGKYALSGSAVLLNGLTPLHNMTISFSRKKLDCGH